MRLIDADALKKHYAWWEDDRQKLFDSIVDSQPTVDAVPVVRCKDCKWWPYHPIERQIGNVKTFLCAIPPASREDENGFCSMAERKSK